MSILQKNFRRLLASAASVIAMSVAAPAHAGIIASFDPAFGSGIPNLGFKGTITLDASAGCFQTPFVYQFTGNGCSITAQAGELSYYNSTMDPAANNILSTLTLDPYISAGLADNYVTGAIFDAANNLLGFDSFESTFFDLNLVDNTGDPLTSINFDGSLMLYFVSGYQPRFEEGRASASTSAVAAPITPDGTQGAYLEICSSDGEICRVNYDDPTQTSNPGRLTFRNTVPEPDGLALGLLGVGALLAARRRRASIAR